MTDRKGAPTGSASVKKKRGDTSERIYEQLKQEILAGEIESGTLLSEAVIAQRFEVSRTPVRDALNRLACERVITSLPQRGHLVRTISLSEVMEAYRVRELLEVEAAGEAARRITDEDLDYLKSLLTDHGGDFALMNYRIHSAIVRIGGNRLVAEFVEETLVLMQRMIANHPDRELIMEDALELERLVIEALETRDPEAAREAMRYHLAEVMEKLLRPGVLDGDVAHLIARAARQEA